MSFSTARPQCDRSWKSTRVWSAFTLDLMGIPLIVLRPLKSRSKSLPSLLPPSLMIWLTVMPRFFHVAKLIAYMAVEQEHAWENLGITVSQIIKEGGSSDGNDLDLLFSGRKTMSGIPIKSSVNADQTRVDFLDLSHWGRAVLKDIDFYEVNGNTVFPIYGASGGLA